MSADGSANRSARARLWRLDSQALLPRCSGYRCPGDPARQRRRALLPAIGVQRPPLEELNLVHRSASLRICGPRSSPALSEELTQISAARFPPATRCSHRVHTKKPGLQGGWDRALRSQNVGVQGNAASAAKVRKRATPQRVPKRLAASQGARDSGYAAFRVSRPISRITNRR
jgi:hypothetical protein